MKSIFFLLLLIAFSFSSKVYAYTDSLGFEYPSTSSSTITIIGYSGTGGALTLSSTINSVPVVGIASGAFAYQSQITSLVLPSTISSIGVGAFASMSGLTSITFPATLTAIPSLAFIADIHLNNIIIPATVTSIGDRTFAQDSSLTSVYFAGAAPALSGSYVFSLSGSNLILFYHSGQIGWTSPTWNGYTTGTY